MQRREATELKTVLEDIKHLLGIASITGKTQAIFPICRKLRQKDFCKFKASFIYKVNPESK